MFDLWPATADPAWGRRFLMSDLEARRLHDEALDLDGMLAGYGANLDASLDSDAAISRISRKIMVRLPQRVPEVRWWAPRIAAGFMLAVMAGGMFDIYLADRNPIDSIEVASLDTLIFGPAELDLP